MNDAPSSSAAAGPSPPNDDIGQDESDRPLTAKQLARQRKKNRENFQRKRADLLDDLLRNLDILIYAELSTIYYMDCRFLLFFLRAAVQFYFLTPKPAIFPPLPENRPFIGYIVGINLLCILLHSLLVAPSAGEATRGYLHGGLAMDFIGQKGPSSKVHLFLLDCFVLWLQIVHLSAYLLRQKLRQGLRDGTGAAETSTSTSTTQTVEDEERGVRRSAEQERSDDIELQTLTSSGFASPSQLPSDGQLDAFRPPTRTEAHIFDAFNSGQMVIADLNPFQTVKDQLMMISLNKTDADDNERATRHRQMRQRLTQRLWQRLQG